MLAWEEITEFPDYAVSNQGDIVNMRSGAPRKLSINQQGIVKVSLYLEGRIMTRSVAVLVAEAFVQKEYDHFDTVIHLDGDRRNCKAENLMWRPRWFAIAYHKQFLYDTFHNATAHIVDVETGKEYHSVKEACMDNGLYYMDVIKSFTNGQFCPITYQEFRVVQK